MKTPTLILHSQEDDLASKKNALYMRNNIGASDVRLVLLDDCYHMLPIDNQRDVVAAETVAFFKDRTSLRRKLKTWCLLNQDSYKYNHNFL
ncbi:MAG: alpha/beta hydrolase [Dissulfurimicrobium sp.]|uniref:alpha/beta hydrolase n=1 Tax=Dissulfurimicrobium sp. TaxID=2022436 RepID=UPI00404A30AC